MVKYLLRTRNDKDAVNVQNHHGKTLLHIAAATNNLPLCKLIINHECDKNALMKHAVSDRDITQSGNLAYAIYCIFHGCKNDNFQIKKNCDIFLYFSQNIEWVNVSTALVRRF